jgi:hypothetical protein
MVPHRTSARGFKQRLCLSAACRFFYVNGGEFFVELAGSTSTTFIVAEIATYIAAAVLGSTSVPLVAVAAIGAGAAIGGTLLWDALDDALGVSDALDVLFNSQSVDILYEVNGVIQKGWRGRLGLLGPGWR